MIDVEQASQPTVDRITPGVALCNFLADTAPTTTDDETKGYAENSVWYKSDTPPLRMWKCVDPAESAANWVEIQLTFNGLQVGVTFVDGASGNFLYNNGGQLGSYTPSNALNALLPSQTGNAGKVLQTNGTVPSWADPGGGLTVGAPVTGGGANRVLFEDGSQNLATNSGFYFNGTNLYVGVPITSPHTGSHSERFGLSSQATGEASSAFGKLALATADNTTAVGYDAQASSNGGVAIGKSSRATNLYGNGVAIGKDALASGSENPTAIGQGSNATGNKSVAIGSGADATADSTFAMGYNALANAAGNMAIGYEANSTGAETSIAIGKNLTVSGNNGIGIGAGVSVTSDRGIGIGDRTSSTHTKSIALGQQAATTADNQFVVGSANAPITEIRQVYDGSTRFTVGLSSAGVVTFDAVGSGAKFVFSDDVEMTDAKNVILNSTTGSKIGTASTQKVGFFGVTPVTQRTNIGAVTDSTTGSVGSSLDDVGGTFDQSTINDNFATIADRLNKIEQIFQDTGITN